MSAQDCRGISDDQCHALHTINVGKGLKPKLYTFSHGTDAIVGRDCIRMHREFCCSLPQAPPSKPMWAISALAFLWKSKIGGRLDL